jgi:hypothetical protein
MSGIGGTLLDGIVGGGLDKMGRPGAIAVNSLLSGEDTGMWHVMVGNPINPIISVGNLILEKADIEFDGVLGPDDFPNKLKVICTLKPARPRAREGIIDMFHRNGRTYTTYDPKKMVSKINITKRKRPQDTPPLLVGKPINDDDSSRYITQRYDSANHPDHPNIYNDRFSGWLGGMTDDDLIVVSAAQGIF